MLAIRGRRQSGKSRLVAELVESAGVPYLFTTAVKNASPAVQVAAAVVQVVLARPGQAVSAARAGLVLKSSS